MNGKINKADLAKFGDLEFIAKQAVEGFITGMHKSPFHGFSVEFAEHRLYNKGESTKHIDWKLFGKTDKLFTKKYEEETNLRCQIVIDTSSSMHFPLDKKMNKLRFSAYSAASLIELLKRQRDAVGLSFFDTEINLHTENKTSTRHHVYLYSELEKLLNTYNKEHTAKTSTAESIHQIAELTHQRSLVVIFTDLLDPKDSNEDFFHAIQHLKHNKHEVIVFHTIDKSIEMDFELENRPYEFVDLESGEKIKLNPSQIKEKYLSEIKNHFSSIKETCGSYGVDFVTADINEGYNQILMNYMIKRNKTA